MLFKQFSVRTNRCVLAALPARDSRLVNAELLSELLLSESEGAAYSLRAPESLLAR